LVGVQATGGGVEARVLCGAGGAAGAAAGGAVGGGGGLGGAAGGLRPPGGGASGPRLGGGVCAPWGPQERPTVLESQFTQIGPAVGPANSDTRLLLGGSSTIGRTLVLFPDSLDLLHAFQCMVR